MTPLPSPSVPVSWGELLDKLTILDIKLALIPDPAARANVAREREALVPIAAPALAADGIAPLMRELAEVNAALWRIEDDIRDEEAAGRFGEAFVALARAVYRTNDRRAAIKRRINLALRSDLVEEKSYADFAAAD